MDSPDCLSEETVLELLEGRLEGEALESAERHLSQCAQCPRLVADVARALSSKSESGGPGPRDAARAPLAGGTRVGRYVVLEPVGEGAMGRVYAARDPQLDRKVALKILHPRAAGPDLEARLLREAKAMARLSHSEVITVFDAGTFGEQLFIAMEFVEGGTLRQWLAEKPRTWRDVLAVYLRAGRGLAQAHAVGLVHRDFKPDNVLIGDDGRVRVTDFGLARTSRAKEDEQVVSGGDSSGVGMESTIETPLTRSGALVGTPAYMPPEQAMGAPADERSDVYSYCVALYEGLYGERPFVGKTFGTLQSAKIAGDVRAPVAAHDVPAQLRRVLLGGLKVRPQDRYASMKELLVALEAASRARRGPWLVGGMVLLAAAAAGIVTARSVRSSREARAAAAASARAVAARCTSNRACAESHGGEPYACRASDGACVGIASEDCAPMFEPGDATSEDTVWLGVMLPTKGASAASFGAMNLEGANFARREIAKATAALGGATASRRVRRIALVACDDVADAPRAARHLVDDVGVPAILGFQSGQELIDLAGSSLVQRGVLSVATMTSNPLITRVPQPVGAPRMVWRTAYSFDAVGEVIAQVIAVLEDPPQRGATRVTLVREESGGSLSFAESFYRRLRFNGKSALENANAYQEVTIAASRSAADVEAAADRIAAGAPTFLAVQGDPKWTVPLLTRVESKVRLGARRPTYLLGLTSPKPFKDFLGRMADRRRRFLSVDTIPNEPNNARFVIRYNQEHATPVTRTFNPGMTYDATYALAYATFALGSEPVTGPSLAGAFGRLLAPGRPIDVGPSDVFDAVTTLAGGGAIDLRGTESGLDFDLATGEDPFDFTVYCPAVDADGAATGEEVSSGVVFRTSSRKVEGALRCP